MTFVRVVAVALYTSPYKSPPDPDYSSTSVPDLSSPSTARKTYVLISHAEAQARGMRWAGGDDLRLEPLF